jgi:glutathione peroxidase-family protein
MVQSSPRVTFELLELIEILDTLSKPSWQFWTQERRSLAQIYSWTLTEFVKEGTLEEVLDFYSQLRDSDIEDAITARLVIELAKILRQETF